jgi:hypothetical protein
MVAHAVLSRRSTAAPKCRSIIEVTNEQLRDLLVDVRSEVGTLKMMGEARDRASDARDKVVAGIDAKMDAHKDVTNALVTDMAILKTQHASFWKAVAILAAIVPALGGAIAWIVSTIAGKS